MSKVAIQGIKGSYHHQVAMDFFGKKIEIAEFMSFDEKKLRMGKQIDSGNIEFLKFGYGGLKDIQVNPSSIDKVKHFLSESGIQIRKV